MHHPFMDKLRKPCWTDAGKLLLRLAIGAVFVNHGSMKFKAGALMIGAFFGRVGIPMPGLTAPFIMALEFVGGLMLMAGLGTRVLGVLFFLDMAVAIGAVFGWHAGKAELETLLGLASLALFCMDGGAYSLDAWLMKRSRKAHESALPVAETGK